MIMDKEVIEWLNMYAKHNNGLLNYNITASKDMIYINYTWFNEKEKNKLEKIWRIYEEDCEFYFINV